MSYILDALRRADAERERGVVPGLHSNTTAADPEPAARDYRPLLYAAAAAGALLVAVVVILLSGTWRGAPAGAPTDVADPRSREAAGAAATTRLDDSTSNGAAIRPRQPSGADDLASAGGTPPGTGMPARTALAQDRPAAVAARMAPGRLGTVGPDAATTGTPLPRQGQAAPIGNAPGPRERTAATQQPPAATTNAAPGVEHYGAPLGATPTQPPAAAANPPVTSPPAAPVVAPAVAPAAVPAIRKFEELPAATRSAMPRFTVGGAIYSDTPSARMLILNGQVYHEGDHPTPDTLLEQIKLKSAVMNYRGTRYEIAF